MKRFSSFDGLRAVAVLLVFSHHLIGRYLPGGWIGVDLFFALSGYLITTLLLGEHINTGRIDLRAFYIRRALRLIPALVAFIAIVTPIAIIARVSDVPLSAIAALTYMMDIYSPMTGSGEIFSHTWSLAVEEQFYLVWPFVLVASLRRRWPMLRLVASIILAGAIIGAIIAGTLSTHAAYSSPFPHLPALAGGVVLALALHQGGTWLRHLDNLAIPIIATATIVTVLVLVPKEALFVYLGAKLAIAILAVVLLGHLVVKPTGIVTWALASRPLVWLGKRSYGFYLWHFPVTWVAHHLPIAKIPAAGFALAASFALTELSWQAVEQPFLRLKSRFDSPIHPTGESAIEKAPIDTLPVGGPSGYRH